MIVDFHTHIFPPEVIEQRDRYLREDPTFALLYADPKAKLATAQDLLESMERGGIDMSVALGFQWTSEATCLMHNDYLIDAAQKSGGRIEPFCILPLASGLDAVQSEMLRCSHALVRGFGELRPGNAGFDMATDGKRLGELATIFEVGLVFHVSEPVGHAYPGKEGLAVGDFFTFVSENRGAMSIGAHWGGGLPFYALMPEVHRRFVGGVYVDTAASSLLYDDGIYEDVVALIGAGSVLFGSDFPLLSQKRSRERIEASGLDDIAKAAMLGDNAIRLLNQL